MQDLMPPTDPYVIDNINLGDQYVTINYSDPAAQGRGIMHFDQLVFPAEMFEDDLGEITDLVCQLIDKVQTARRGPAERIRPRVG